MKGAGIDPKTSRSPARTPSWPAIQRILAGDQYMTVYKPIKPLAEKAAEWAVALAKGQKPTDANTTENNGKVDVPTLKIDVIGGDGRQGQGRPSSRTATGRSSEICTGGYAAACKKHGIQ